MVMRQREGKPGGGKGPLLSEESLTLATANDQTIFQPVGFSHTQGLDAQPPEDAFPTLRREGSGHAVAQPVVKTSRAQSATDAETWVDGEIAPTLNTHDNTGPVRATVLVPYTDHVVATVRGSSFAAYALDDVGGSLKAAGGDLSQGGSESLAIVSWWNGDDIADTVTTTSNEQRMPDKNRLQAVVTPYAVRRLLPIECERLMGWPDDWTRWDADGKEQADSHRYKQCGNGVASPVAEWVGRHIFAADAIGRAR